jgi:hypothetical protein
MKKCIVWFPECVNKRVKVLLLVLGGIAMYSFQASGNQQNTKAVKQGRVIERYSNGEIKRILNYKNDTLHGKLISFFSNGKPEIEKTFFRGKEIDTTKIFLEDGSLSQMFIYYDSFRVWSLIGDSGEILQSQKEYYPRH